jgi:hypothetical protein
MTRKCGESTWERAFRWFSSQFSVLNRDRNQRASRFSINYRWCGIKLANSGSGNRLTENQQLRTVNYVLPASLTRLGRSIDNERVVEPENRELRTN